MMRLLVYKLADAGGQSRTFVAGVLAGDDALNLPDGRRYVIDGNGAAIADELDAAERKHVVNGEGVSYQALLRDLGNLTLEEP